MGSYVIWIWVWVKNVYTFFIDFNGLGRIIESMEGKFNVDIGINNLYLLTQLGSCSGFESRLTRAAAVFLTVWSCSLFVAIFCNRICVFEGRYVCQREEFQNNNWYQTGKDWTQLRNHYSVFSSVKPYNKKNQKSTLEKFRILMFVNLEEVNWSMWTMSIRYDI